MKRLWQGVTLGSFLMAANWAQAETAYIVDQLLVGLHQAKDINSPISKVLATGTEVEIIRREGDYAEIREHEEGKVGWVDASYLMLEQPAKIRLAAVEAELNRLKSQSTLQENQAKLLEKEQAHAEEVSTLTTELDSLKQSLSSEKLKVGELEATISQQEKSLAQMEAATDPDRLTQLQQQNEQLQKELEETKLTTSDNKSMTDMTEGPLQLIKNRTVQISLAVLAIAAFLFGRHWEDRRVRKRHGGFRI